MVILGRMERTVCYPAACAFGHKILKGPKYRELVWQSSDASVPKQAGLVY